jgi:hypothetical protein
MVTYLGQKLKIEGTAALLRLSHAKYTDVQQLEEDLDKAADLIVYNALK